MRGNRLRRFLLFAFASVLVTSTFLLGLQYVQTQKEEHALKQLQETSATVSANPPAETESAPALLEQYSELSRQNADMIGWIKIDDTKIDYPVMYTGDNFYLEHGFDKAATKSGLPYIDKRCTVEPFGTNTIIYAHNMKNGTMFSGLLRYKNLHYYNEHPTIRFDTLYEVREYNIVAVLESQVFLKSDTVFKPYNFLNAENEAEFSEYIKQIKALSLYDTGVTAHYGDELITLMTCSYHTENGRFVVVAVRNQ